MGPMHGAPTMPMVSPMMNAPTAPSPARPAACISADGMRTW